MPHHHRPTTIAILGADTVVENAPSRYYEERVRLPAEEDAKLGFCGVSSTRGHAAAQPPSPEAGMEPAPTEGGSIPAPSSSAPDP